MKTIIVTGGIGSGKSLVCSFLLRRGIPVYDSDSKVKEIYGRIPSLAALATEDIFTDGKKLQHLENCLYPVLMDDFRRWAEKCGSEFVAFESAVVLQKEYFDTFGDYVLLVDAPFETRLERAVARGTVGESSIRARMKLQRDERNNPRVDFIIDNIASEAELEAAIDKFLDFIDYGKRKN